MLLWMSWTHGGLNEQVVDKLQSGGKSKRAAWRTELPRAGLGVGVIEKMKDEKRNDVAWQGKCSGTVYVSCHCHGLFVFVLLHKNIKLDFWFLQLCFISYGFFCRYIGGNESEGHFSVINEACSMLVRCCT